MCINTILLPTARRAPSCLLVYSHCLIPTPDAGSSSFLLSVVQSLLGLDWHVKGKYGPLCCMVDHVGVSKLLQLCPNITQQLLMAIREQPLACYVRYKCCL